MAGSNEIGAKVSPLPLPSGKSKVLATVSESSDAVGVIIVVMDVSKTISVGDKADSDSSTGNSTVLGRELVAVTPDLLVAPAETIVRVISSAPVVNANDDKPSSNAVCNGVGLVSDGSESSDMVCGGGT